MRIAVFGTGYVGLVTGTCLAEVGHEVLCVDVDTAKIQSLREGVIPLFEPGLEPLVRANQSAGRLRFGTEAKEAVHMAEVLFIAVGTPPDEDGSTDLSHVLAAAREIGRHLQRQTTIVNKSTVPVGTADQVRAAIAQVLQERGVDTAFDVVSNPEFLKEGAAVHDCLRPDRIIIGTRDVASVEVMRRLYAPFNRNRDRIVVMDERSAELSKYAANAMLATKISFMNEMANIAEKVGADIEQVRQGIGSDPRIGYSFIYAGAGYGGSCFPKDVQALKHAAQRMGCASEVLEAVHSVNQRQKHKLFELIQRHFPNGIRGKTVAVWGLAFKPNTDDMREAPSRTLLSDLWAAGARVQVFDPEAMREADRGFGKRDDLRYADSPMAAVQGADFLVVVTEWKAFWNPDFAAIRAALREPVIFDGRNIHDPSAVETAGLAYYGIGRGRSVQRSV